MVRETQVLDACKELFGAEVAIEREFLHYIQPSGVKTAYRKKALATHPDRMAILNFDSGKDYNDLFRKATDAYNILTSYLEKRDSGYRFTQPHFRNFSTSSEKKSTPPQKKTAKKKNQSSPRQKSIPKRYLTIGEFLYYAGIISWKDMVSAIVWQRSQRQRIGEIAQRWGYLSEEEVSMFLRNRRLGEPFGSILLRHRAISPYQLRLMLWHQRKKQRPIGEYFIKEGLVLKTHIERYVNFLETHNSLYRK